MKFKIIFCFLVVMFLFSGCTEKTTFKKGDIKDDFCGVLISAQYCKCAFHNEYCDSIGLSKGAANSYVQEQYKNWVDSQLEAFERNCRNTNGIVKGKSCSKCGEGKVVVNNKCVKVEDQEVADDSEEGNVEEEEKGECKYDSDCDSICEGNVMWKMGCNPRENICEKTFETDCAEDIETFGEQSFSKVCSAGQCVRDDNGIAEAKAKLAEEKQMWSDTVKEINSVRADINVAMLEANKNCINGIADMTNVAIIEFSTRIASVLAGGIPDVAAMAATAAEKASGLMAENIKNLAGAAVDYVGEGLNRLYNYQSGEPAEEEKKLKPHEYIKLNCDLYNYFINVQAESDVDLQTALDGANEADRKLKELP